MKQCSEHKRNGARTFREKFYTSQDNLQLYYRDYGDPLAPKLPVLCLGGLTRNSKDFDRLARDLAESRRVLCPDYRGRGRSQYDDNWRNYRPPVYLDDIRHLLAATNIHRVFVIGTSMGGLLAVGLAALLPTVVAGVVLNDVGPKINADGLARILDYVGTDRPQTDWPQAVAHLKVLFPRIGLETEEDWLQLTKNTFREGDDGLLHHDWDTNLVKPLLHPEEELPDLWRLYGALENIPVAVMRGENSDVLDEDTFAHMVRMLPNVTAVTIPGKGHTPTLNEPEARALIAKILD